MVKKFDFNNIDNEFDVCFIPLRFGKEEIIDDKFIIPSKKIILWKTMHFERLDIYINNKNIFDIFLSYANRFLAYANYDDSIFKILITSRKTNNEIILYSDMILESLNPAMCVNDVYICSMNIPLLKKRNENFEEEFNKIATNKKEIITDEDRIIINDLINQQNNSDWFTPTQKKKNSFSDLFKKTLPKTEENFILKSLTSNKNSKTDAEATPEVISSSQELMPNYNIVAGIEKPLEELDKLIGIESVKKDVKKLQYKLEYNEERQKRGIMSEKSTMHMVFTGNPGTGKTTIARILTGILYDLKYIKKNQCVEISGMDLVGGFVGQTAILTKNVIEIARGGILFIDEAYALSDVQTGVGSEAVSVLLKEMEDNRDDLVVIFAGYKNEMENFLNINPGFKSRVNKYFNFEDYNTSELTQIFASQLRKRHLKIDQEPLEKVFLTLKTAKNKNNFSNGRFVRNLIEQIEESHIINTSGINDFERLDTIVAADISDETLKNLINFI